MSLLQSDQHFSDEVTPASRGVVVLGMHRSGTSATARIINMAGVPLCEARDLWLGLPGNETGYWESSSLSRFNERLLGQAGGAWWRPPTDEAISTLAGRADVVQAGAQLFAQLHRGQSWVWKDPRTCLLLRFWRSVLPETLTAVLVVRHPFEVAASLAARDRIPWAWSLALWETYIRRSLTDLAGTRVHVLLYPSLIADPTRSIDDLVTFIRRDVSDAARPDPAAVDEFLRADLRHSNYSDSDLIASGNIGLLEILRAVEQSAGSHECFRSPELSAPSPATVHTLSELAALDPTQTLSAAIQSWSDRPVKRAETTSDRPPSPPAELPSEWRCWIATNLLIGVTESDVIDVLMRSGIGEADAAREIGAIRTDPCFLAGMRVGQQLRKLESVLDMRHELASQMPTSGVVDHLPVITREQFLSRYYANNRPVLIDGLVDDWPALTLWNPQYLKATVPDGQIEVMVDRVGDANFEINSENHKSTMRMADYVDAVVAAGSSNDMYMVANNHFLEKPCTAALWADFTVPSVYLDPDNTQDSIFFWFGPAGTITPLHHDVVNVLFVQVLGSKRITLIPSLEIHNLYNECSVYSSVDALEPDLETYPKFVRAERFEVTIGPGQALFIPVGWWHCVEALETSISMSFTNFVFPNNYDWQHPDLRV